jgi:hypothetical protein
VVSMRLLQKVASAGGRQTSENTRRLGPPADATAR